jgi:hypothetical protein
MLLSRVSSCLIPSSSEFPRTPDGGSTVKKLLDRVPFSPEKPDRVIYSPQAKGLRKEERAPCARIKASRRWPMKS